MATTSLHSLRTILPVAGIGESYGPSINKPYSVPRKILCTQSSREAKRADDTDNNGLSPSLTSLEWLTTTGPRTGSARNDGTCWADERTCTSQKPISYARLTAKAILASPGRRCTFEGVCDWIGAHCLEVTTNAQWRSTVRHTLTLSECFQIVNAGDVVNESDRTAIWTLSPLGTERFANGTAVARRRNKTIRRPRNNSISQELSHAVSWMPTNHADTKNGVETQLLMSPSESETDVQFSAAQNDFLKNNDAALWLGALGNSESMLHNSADSFFTDIHTPVESPEPAPFAADDWVATLVYDLVSANQSATLW